MKAILVIDMPNSCLECEILDHDELTCMGMKIKYGDLNTRQYFCPLKSLPDKRILPKEQVEGTNYGEEPWFSDGYNACLEEIIGEEEI